MYNLPINSSNLYLLVIFLIFQGFLVLLVVFLFIDKFFSSRTQRIEQHKIKEAAFVEATKTLEDAQARAQTIIKEAQDHATKSLTELNLFSTELSQRFEQAMSTAINENKGKLTSVIDKVGADLQRDLIQEKITTVASFDKVLVGFNTDVTSKISQYTELLAHKAVEAEETLSQELLKSMRELHENFKANEAKHLASLKEEALRTLHTLSLKFFRERATQQDNEDLVSKLVEELTLEDISRQ